MTHRDIALLLADAADEVEIGMAPVQAVVRGGRRRRTRRWAVAAAAAVVIAGSTGTLAVAGLQGGDGNRGAPAATQPSATAVRNVPTPRQTLLAVGTFKGQYWQVVVDVWKAPHDEAEAREQLAAMAARGERPTDLRQASELIGKHWTFVQFTLGDADPRTKLAMSSEEETTLSGKEFEVLTTPSDPSDSLFDRLVIGNVARSAQRVTCTWKDGTTTVVLRESLYNDDFNSDEFLIRPVEGSYRSWYLCLAPDGTAYESTKVG
ncbi:hypothetical protein [Streptomyces capitiformicae]|uniref:hypothetical protein n=1 Tax=Streptomyces capitiformicae TaxID=2014920 RepID=UPI001E5BB205|nr:hypothetical protein [Streptomyces capitiformicae]